MSLNSHLLNDASLYAGTGNSKFAVMATDVTVSGEMSTMVYRSLKGGTTARAVTQGALLPWVSMMGGTTCRADTVVTMSRGRSLNAAITARAVTSAKTSFQLALRTTADATAASSSRLKIKRYLATGQLARAQCSARQAGIKTLATRIEAKALSAAVLGRKLIINGGVSARAVMDGRLSERDTRPAPVDRLMIVPFEDRRMKVV